MRRLLVLVSLLVALVTTGPMAAFGQEATPEPGTAAATRTDIRYVIPFTPDGLNPSLTATATTEGVCGFSSIVALDRPDAWDCISADNEIYDPCFENSFIPPDEPGEVACLESPFTTDVVVLTLSEPLVREKEAPDASGDPSMAMGQSADSAIDLWDLPWALELANGDQCTLLHGTLSVMAGQVVHYGCTDGGMILGETDRSQPIWRVNYLPEGDVASNLVEVVTAWS
jgi:hypothetical protein